MQEFLTVGFIFCCSLVIIWWLAGVGGRQTSPNPSIRKQHNKRQPHTWKKMDKTQLTRRIVKRMKNVELSL